MKKRLIIFAALILLFAASIGIAVLAADEPRIEIRYGSLEYNGDSVDLNYAVSFEGFGKTAEKGLLVWKGSPSKYYLKGREDVLITSSERVKIDGKDYDVFSLEGLDIKSLTDEIYAVAYARVGTKMIYSPLNKHSALRYTYIAEGKIGDTPVSDEKVLGFLSEMISAGANAQREADYNTDRLADARFVEITLENGLFADGTSRGLFVSGSLTSVTAHDEYGKMLSDWQTDDGATVASGGLEYIRVPEKSCMLRAIHVAASTGLSYDLMASDARFETAPPDKYEFGKTLVLPEPVRDGYIFAGWYASEDYAVYSAMDTVKAGTKGDIKLYAAWTRLLFNDDYSLLSGINVNASSASGFSSPYGTDFRCSNKDGTTYKSVSGGIAWHAGTSGSDSLIKARGGLAGLMGDGDVITIVAKVARETGKSPAASTARLRVSYKNETIAIFNIGTDGGVYLGGDKSYKLFDLTENMQEIRVVVNFADGTFTAVGEDGVLLATRSFSIPASSIYKTYDEWKNGATTYLLNWYAGGSSITDNSLIVGGVSAWEGNAFLRSTDVVYSVDELIEKIAQKKAENARFNKKLFESPYSPISSISDTTMPTPVYASAPMLYERDGGTGTRLMFTESMLTGILDAFENESYAKSYASLISLADSAVNGILVDPAVDYNGRKGLHNFNASVLAAIEAKAFMFRIMYEQDLEEGTYEAYRRDLYGYEAIVAIKNFLETLDIQYIASDQCREFGYTMFVAAEVYDWCYPLLTVDDMEEIKYAVVARCCSGTSGVTDNSLTTNNGAKMEVGYPPKGQGSVSGHGSEAQILRDYLAFALAIYDEDPTWWEYVAGRVVGDYVAVRNYYHQSGITQQGVSGYAHHRHYSDLYSAWIIQTATGVNPYTRMENTVMSVIASMNPSGTALFSSGDGVIEKALSSAANLALLSSAIYNNDTLFTFASEYKSGFNISSASGTSSITIANMFILISQGMELVEDKYEELDLILYNGYPLGQIISRYEWNNTEAAATHMKLGIRTTANHEHSDAGTFQIYYKGLLTSDSGLYNNYGHEHTQQYQQATIAHNGLLIFNPAKWNYTATSASTKWYSGGQKRVGEAKNLEAWLTDTYDTGVLIGAQYGYKDEAGKKADYAYIAGDISKSYPTDTATLVARSMLTVYNEDKDFPMYFFVFDSIESTDASFKKTFLLHVRGTTEPTIEGNVVTLTNGGGKLVSHTLTDGASIEAIGGIVYNENGKYNAELSRNYLINGYQLVPLDKGNDGNWGRVEISVSGSKKSTFMHAMYVTDKDSVARAPEVKKISANGIEGAIIGDVAAVFLDSVKLSLTSVSFNTEGSGNMRYYVAGLFEGSWNLSVNGEKCGTVTAGEGGMAVFTAKAGEITLTPGEDVMPEGGGHIFYELSGGTLPEGAPTSFKKGGGVTLPIPKNGSNEFVGWYTSPEFDESTKITKIPSGASGEFTVYARWKYVFLTEDYEVNEDIDIEGASDNIKIGGVHYAINDGAKASIEVKSDRSTKTNYLLITPAGGVVSATADGVFDVRDIRETKITYTVELGLSKEGKAPETSFGVKGSTAFTVFNVGNDGSLRIGGTTEKIAYLGETIETYSFTVDFEANTVSAYGPDGALLKTVTVSDVSFNTLGTALFEIKSEGGTFGTTKYSLKIGGIFVRSGE